ncbi:hypothetical protein C8J57DRAFT_710671 [Mycena rebaudengoi]|nr:hypothetical protein C8J57DRAFT_710671 [Mycena rebaudengoi]
MDTSDLLSSTLSDRVKMRKRVAPKASISGPESISSASPFPKAAVAGDVIEISSSDDELNLDSKRAKPATSKSRSKYNVSPLGAFSSSAFPFPSSNDPALKKTGNPIPFGLAPFPQYSNSRHEQQDDFVPPIATLGGSEDTSYDLQPSPSDLPARKDREKGKSRVKTVKLLLPNHEDQLFDTDAEEHGDSDARRMPPPLLPHDSDRLPPVIPGPSSASGPAAVVPADTISTKPPQKRSHKKKVADDGEKPAKKPRAKKGKKDGEGVDAGEQEKPKAKAKKGKGKDKEVEVFKSTEFVVDSSDNEENPQTRVEPVLPHLPMEVDTPIGGPSVEKPISAISIPDSQPDEELLATTKKRKSSVANDDGGAVDADVEEAAATQKKSKKAKIAGVDAEKKKKKAPAKKAKAKTVVSDDEEGDAGGVESLPQDKMDVDAPVQDEDKTGQEPQHGPVSDPEVDADEPPQNKLKKGKRKQAKKMVLSESEGEDDEVALTKPKSKVRNLLDCVFPKILIRR